MKWFAGIVLLVALACCVYVLLSATTEENRLRSPTHELPKTAKPTSAVASHDSSGLRVVGGVAHAPSPDDAAPITKPVDQDAPFKHTWYGFAASAATRHKIAGASVRLEPAVSSEARRWDQPPTDEHGRIVARAPDLENPFRLLDPRLVVTSADDEIAIVPLDGYLVGESGGSTFLGTIYLHGGGTLEGQVRVRDPMALKNGFVVVQRFGELRVAPGFLDVVTPDGNGDFVFERLPFGSYVVKAALQDGQQLVAAPVVVPQDKPLVLRPLPSAPLTVLVKDTAGEVALVLVKLRARTRRPQLEPLALENLLEWFEADADDDERHLIPYLPLGDYLVVVWSDFIFEFPYTHRRKETLRLTIPTITELPVRFVLAGSPREFLRNTRVRVALEGRSLSEKAPKETSLSVTTDGNGVAWIPRIGAESIELTATAPGLRGAAQIAVKNHREGQMAATVRMSPTGAGPVGKGVKQEKLVGFERRVLVVTPDGLPVQGAELYVVSDSERVSVAAGERKKTNAQGLAFFGPAISTDRVHLRRPDLASGDLRSDEFGSVAVLTMTWIPGFRVVVKVTDAEFGFPIDKGVGLGPRRKAWKQTDFGVFETRWDPGAEKYDVAVSAEGFAPWSDEHCRR